MFLFSKQHEELIGIYASQLAHHRCIDLFVHMMELRMSSRYFFFLMQMNSCHLVHVSFFNSSIYFPLVSSSSCCDISMHISGVMLHIVLI